MRFRRRWGRRTVGSGCLGRPSGGYRRFAGYRNRAVHRCPDVEGRPRVSGPRRRVPELSRIDRRPCCVSVCPSNEISSPKLLFPGDFSSRQDPMRMRGDTPPVKGIKSLISRPLPATRRLSARSTSYSHPWTIVVTQLAGIVFSGALDNWYKLRPASRHLAPRSPALNCFLMEGAPR